MLAWVGRVRGALRVRPAVRYASTRADTVGELSTYMLKEREALLSNPTPSAADSLKIKDLDPVHKAWTAWQEKIKSLQST